MIPRVTWKFLVLLFIFGSLFSISLQEASSLQGTISDPSGGAIPEAFITVHWDRAGAQLRSKEDIRQDITVQTNQKGEFSITLAPGFYDIFVSAMAFSPTCKKIRITKEQPNRLNFRLQLSGLVTSEIMGDRVVAAPKVKP